MNEINKVYTNTIELKLLSFLPSMLLAGQPSEIDPFTIGRPMQNLPSLVTTVSPFELPGHF